MKTAARPSCASIHITILFRSSSIRRTLERSGGTIMRNPIVLIIGIIFLASCGAEQTGSTNTTPTKDSLPEVSSAPSFAGTYLVRGTTMAEVPGAEPRDISGTIILTKEQGGGYSATFSMKTTYPNPSGGQVPADVIGKGEGSMEGEILRGTASTQLVMGTVPGVDTKFAFVPSLVGPKIQSRMTAQRNEKGDLVIETRNVAADGEDYIPTRTNVVGTLVSTTSDPTKL